MNIDIQSLLITYLVLVLVILVALVIVSHLVAKAARMKNRSYGSFFWMCLLIGPLIPAIIVATLPFNLDDPRHPRNKFRVEPAFVAPSNSPSE